MNVEGLNVVAEGSNAELAHRHPREAFDRFDVFVLPPLLHRFESEQMESSAHEDVQKKQLTHGIADVEAFDQNIVQGKVIARMPTEPTAEDRTQALHEIVPERMSSLPRSLSLCPE